MKAEMQRARLIPVSGIGSIQEAEQRATSAFLAVLTKVRDLSVELLSPMGAPRAQKAEVESFIEVMIAESGRRIRPDGLIRVSYGKKTWSAVLEVKTGSNMLEADQINGYWDLARDTGIDQVLTISNELSADGLHPTPGLKVRANSRVGVSHLSWTEIITSANRIKRHKGISDPEQAWLLDELIRYLQHPKSGALQFEDMGGAWPSVRDAAREGTLTRRTPGVEDVVGRWEQLLRFAAMQLSAEIGDDVDLIYARGQSDPQKRLATQIDSLCATGQLAGTLRIPHTAGDLQLIADLRARRLSALVDLQAPQDRGARGRVSWLVGQLPEAPSDLMIESFVRNARLSTSATLAQAQEDRLAPLDSSRNEPHRFRLVMRSEMGMGRKRGMRNSGFIDSVLDLVTNFYGGVIQHISPWQRPAPKLAKESSLIEPEQTEPIQPEEVNLSWDRTDL